MLAPILSALLILHLGAIVMLLAYEHREPTATLAWFLTLIFLPGVGLFLYLTIGRIRAVSVARRYLRVVAQLRRVLDRYALTEKLASAGQPASDPRTEILVKLGRRLAFLPESGSNLVDILVDAKVAYPSMLAAIERATQHVHVEFYIWQPDDTGRKLRDALVQCAARGVEVRVVCDSVGSGKLPADFFKPLVDAGGNAAWFRPVSRLLARLPWRDRIDFRNHRKLIIVDGRIGFTGGINIGREYLGLDPTTGYWRDTHVRIEGPAVLSLQKAFAEDWLLATDHLLEEPTYFPDPRGHGSGTDIVQVIDSGPDRLFSPISYLFTQSFALARDRIWVTSPYFIPSPAIQEALIGAALRGVDVRLLVPLRPDHRLVWLASQTYFPRLLDAGVRIFRYGRGFVHAKTMVVDHWVGTVGSANLDMRSFHLNYELNAFVFGRDFCTKMAEQFEADLRNADELQRRPVSLPLRLLHSSARMLSPLL